MKYETAKQVLEEEYGASAGKVLGYYDSTRLEHLVDESMIIEERVAKKPIPRSKPRVQNYPSRY